ncbi:MAG TPA: contractile injection system tape measure protein, partial [Rheinheimera sp.]|nr:contractile injection system tape measure protein [Rheinheimera sp.]
TVAFYRKLQSRLEQTRPTIARNVLLRQLQRLIHYEAPLAVVATKTPHQTEVAQQAAMVQPGVVAEQNLQVVMNAGLVLAAPYLPLLWQRLGWLDAQHFNSARHAWQACALLHYMATGEANAQIEADYWQQWRLGMLLTGRQPPCPIDMDISLSTTQRELADSLLAGILAQWPKLAHSSAETLRECFLQRSGSLCQLGNGSGWQLQLDSGPYDMLLDGLPWSFSLICYPWMRGELYVHWRG